MSRSARQPVSGPHAAFAGGLSAWIVPAHERREVCQCDLIADLRAAKLARDFTRTALPGREHGELADDVALVASELVTNAVRHGVPHAPHTVGDPTVRLGFVRQADFVLCMVHDGGITTPTVKQVTDVTESARPDPLREAGRGLRIVAELATDWGWTPPDRNGKTVWALFAAADRQRATDDAGSPAVLHQDRPTTPYVNRGLQTTLPSQHTILDTMRCLHDWPVSPLLDGGPADALTSS